MKHAVIAGHPNAQSFTMTMAETYCAAVRARGHQADLRDLHRMDFDPRMQANELPGAPDFGPAPDVAAERAHLADADVFVFVYPLWFNAPPAIIKGYIDRVFGMGFGYGGHAKGANPPLLGGRKLISLTSSGAPGEWLRQQDSWEAIRILFDRHLASVCGLTELDHAHFGGIHPGMGAHVVEQARARVNDLVALYF